MTWFLSLFLLGKAGQNLFCTIVTVLILFLLASLSIVISLPLLPLPSFPLQHHPSALSFHVPLYPLFVIIPLLHLCLVLSFLISCPNFLSLSCLPSLRELTTNRSLDNLDCLVGQSDSQHWDRERNFGHGSSTLGRGSGVSQVSSLTLSSSLVCFCHRLPCLLGFTVLLWLWCSCHIWV